MIVLVNTQALDNDQSMVIYVQVHGARTVWCCLLQAILDQCHMSNVLRHYEQHTGYTQCYDKGMRYCCSFQLRDYPVWLQYGIT